MFAQLLRGTGKLSTVFSLAVVFASVCGIAKADSFSTRYGQNTCTETVDNKDGRSLELYGEVHEETGDATVGFKYVIEFQKPNTRINRCDSMNSLAMQRMRLDLERQKLELEIMRERHETSETVGTRREEGW
jgi:hypothetical protein